MIEPNLLKQKQRGIKRDFLFEKDRLIYGRKTLVSEDKIPIPYEKIDLISAFDTRTSDTPPARHFATAQIILFLIAGLNAFRDVPKSQQAISVLMAIAGACLYMLSYKLGLFSVRMTVFHIFLPTSKNVEKIEVIYDNNFDEIINTLRFKWKERITLLYGNADVDADHEEELSRLRWLRDNGIIDDHHYHSEANRLASAKVALFSQPRIVN